MKPLVVGGRRCFMENDLIKKCVDSRGVILSMENQMLFRGKITALLMRGVKDTDVNAEPAPAAEAEPPADVPEKEGE